MLEIDRYALSRAAQFQAEVLAHYEVYEFHPVVAKLQLYCSEDLGAFYLDILKDRLYTTAPSRWPAAARRRRCGTSPRHAALDGAVPELHAPGGLEGGRPADRSSWRPTPAAGAVPTKALLAVGPHPRDPRPGEQGDRGPARRRPGRLLAAGDGGPDACAADHPLLASLGDDLKFVFITVRYRIGSPADALSRGGASSADKCERCWHYRDDVGQRPGASPPFAGAAPATCSAPVKAA